MIALPSKALQWITHGHMEEDDQQTPGKEIWRRRCGSRMDKYSWRKMEVAAQNRAENGKEWSVACLPKGAIWLQSSHCQLIVKIILKIKTPL